MWYKGVNANKTECKIAGESTPIRLRTSFVIVLFSFSLWIRQQLHTIDSIVQFNLTEIFLPFVLSGYYLTFCSHSGIQDSEWNKEFQEICAPSNTIGCVVFGPNWCVGCGEISQ